MARKDALLRLHESLVAQRDSLHKKLARELNLSQSVNTDPGDAGDVARSGATRELHSHLAALESRELRQIERAIAMIREGRYGKCEHCDQNIPITRLKAVPFTPLCVACQRELEDSGQSLEDFEADWAGAYEFEGRMSQKEWSLNDIDVDA